MGASEPRPWNGITSKLRLLVKGACALWVGVLTTGIFPVLSLAEDTQRVAPIPYPPPPNTGLAPERLAPIEVRSFDVRIQRRSSSGDYYLIEDIDDIRTRVGTILLLKKGVESVMAFRVLKTYYKERLIAARQVRRYGDYRALNGGEMYVALEKLQNIPPPPMTVDEEKEVAALEDGAQDLLGIQPEYEPGSVPATGPGPDPEPALAELPPPPVETPPEIPPAELPTQDRQPDESIPTPADNAEVFLGDLDDDELASIQVNELKPFDKTKYSFSLQFGMLMNYKLVEESGKVLAKPNYFEGMGIRLGMKLGDMIFVGRPTLQDSLMFETGAFWFKTSNHDPDSSGDAFDVFPIAGTLRYNLHFSPDLAIFLYGGAVKNFVIKNSAGTDRSVEALASLIPAAGGGMALRFGPNWEIRVDLGLDMIGTGIVLRF